MPPSRARPIGRTKELRRDAAARTALKSGADLVANTVKLTLGPGGRQVVLDGPRGRPLLTTDGYRIGRSIRLPDRFEDMGAQIMREAGETTTRAVGDGATTAVVIGQAMISEGIRLIAAGSHAMTLIRGLESAVRHVVRALEAEARPVDGSPGLDAVASTACGDVSVGSVVGEMVARLGPDGQVRVQAGASPGVHARYVHGMQLDRGWYSPRLLTDQARQEAVLDGPAIVITQDRIHDPHLMARLLERVVPLRRPIVLIALEIDNPSLQLLVDNVREGKLRALAIRAPGFGATQIETLSDLAAFTGGVVIQGLDLALRLAPERLTPSLGNADRVTAWHSATLVEGGAGKPDVVVARMAVIREQMAKAEPGFERATAEERLARLGNRVGVVEVGLPTDTEQQELIRRLTDTVTATKAAQAEGVLPGGGAALAVIGHALGRRDWPDEHRFGVLCAQRALAAPLRQIAANAGFEGELVVKKVQELGLGWGFNARTAAYAPMYEQGIVDPLTVTRAAVLHGASVAMMILSTNTAVHYAPSVRWPSVPPRLREDL